LTEEKNTFHTPLEHKSESIEKAGYDVDVELDEEKLEKPNFIDDPFRPFDDLPDEKHWVVTVRAVFVGLCAGALVNASNVYLGLKTGWTFSANLFGVCVHNAQFCSRVSS
jgi:hypothetical protein